MSERMKKILFAVFFVTFSVAMGYLLYWLFFRAQVPTAPTQTATSTPTGNLPQAGTGVPISTTSTTGGGLPQAGVPTVNVQPTTAQASSPVQLLLDSQTMDISPSPDKNGTRFYNPGDGRFYRIADDGTVTALSNKQFYNVSNVNWGNVTDKAIVNFPDGSKLYYDFNTDQQVNLPAHWNDFNFSPNDTKVAAKSVGVDPSNRFLIVSNPDGTEAKAVQELGDNVNSAQVSWSPSGQIIGYVPDSNTLPGGSLQQDILFIGQNKEKFPFLTAPGADFLPSWSPSGNHLLFSVWSPESNAKPDLWIASSNPASIGADRTNLHIETWADKCAWASDSVIYCGVPRNLPANAGIQRSDFVDYPDDVYKIDLNTGVSQKVPIPDQNIPISAPVVSADQSKLIFTDAVTGQLYSYKLQ